MKIKNFFYVVFLFLGIVLFSLSFVCAVDFKSINPDKSIEDLGCSSNFQQILDQTNANWDQDAKLGNNGEIGVSGGDCMLKLSDYISGIGLRISEIYLNEGTLSKQDGSYIFKSDKGGIVEIDGIRYNLEEGDILKIDGNGRWQEAKFTPESNQHYYFSGIDFTTDSDVLGKIDFNLEENKLDLPDGTRLDSLSFSNFNKKIVFSGDNLDLHGLDNVLGVSDDLISGKFKLIKAKSIGNNPKRYFLETVKNEKLSIGNIEIFSEEGEFPVLQNMQLSYNPQTYCLGNAQYNFYDGLDPGYVSINSDGTISGQSGYSPVKITSGTKKFTSYFDKDIPLFYYNVNFATNDITYSQNNAGFTFNTQEYTAEMHRGKFIYDIKTIEERYSPISINQVISDGTQVTKYSTIGSYSLKNCNQYKNGETCVLLNCKWDGSECSRKFVGTFIIGGEKDIPKNVVVNLLNSKDPLKSQTLDALTGGWEEPGKKSIYLDKDKLILKEYYARLKK